MANQLWVYDFIGQGFFEDGVTAAAVRDELAKMDKKKPIEVRINSPGGDVFEAVAIRTQLAQWEAGVNVQVDGVAASAASYIATVGEIVAIADGGMLMIHDPYTVAIGNAAELSKTAGLLDKIAGSLVQAYAKKSGQDEAAVRDAMLAETWYTADEAIAFGLANAKATEKAAAFTIPKLFGFKHAPQEAEATQRPLSRIAAMKRRDALARLSTSAQF